MSGSGGASGSTKGGEGYRSPALSRLERTERHWPPARQIAPRLEPAPRPPAPDERLAAFEARLELLEQRQLDLLVNLQQANQAFRRLAARVGALAERLERLAEEPGVRRPPATDRPS